MAGIFSDIGELLFGDDGSEDRANALANQQKDLFKQQKETLLRQETKLKEEKARDRAEINEKNFRRLNRQFRSSGFLQDEQNDSVASKLG